MIELERDAARFIKITVRNFLELRRITDKATEKMTLWERENEDLQ
jgi:hypothetical protein